MFLFARWITTSYVDCNSESGEWWKIQLKFFKDVVYPNYQSNGTVQNTINFLLDKKTQRQLKLEQLKLEFDDKINVGDELLCVAALDTKGQGFGLTVGKYYKVQAAGYLYNDKDSYLRLMIFNDFGEKHYFSIESPKHYSYYGKWFTTIKELRRNKLEKIQDSKNE